MFNRFFKEKEYVPSRPGEYIHKLDEREETLPIFKYRIPSDPITDKPKNKITIGIKKSEPEELPKDKMLSMSPVSKIIREAKSEIKYNKFII